MDDNDWAGVLVFLIFAPIIILLWIIWELREPILYCLAMVAIAILKTHLAIGLVLVIIVRDWLVAEFWRDVYSDQAARALIVFWLVVFPILLVMAGLSLGSVFALPSVGVILWGYYQYYFESPITDHRLSRFVKEQYMMKAEAQLVWVDLSARTKVWIRRKFSK